MLMEMVVNSIIQFIEDNLEKHFINIESLVVYSGYSRRHLQITFKKHMNIPIGKYIRTRRASRAAALLRLSRMPIIDISERFFYDSQQTFTREFKKIMGYTPRQYRKNSFWSFKNLLGRRYVDYIYPHPELCYLSGEKVSGKYYDYRELIIYTGVDSKTRWGKVIEYLKQREIVVVSSKIPFYSKGNNAIARTVVWTEKAESSCNINIEQGLYAHFSFSGTFDEYINHMYNIYYNSLPLCGLNKRDAYDIEIIKKEKDNILLCHYYLPVCLEGGTRRDVENVILTLPYLK
ncbi:helix-turn-helix domain-containing protein [Salmonella enterica subsp. enterica]|nr:helix-turn-helix domain-containing protein [Salmonella enterica subsp. enterica]